MDWRGVVVSTVAGIALSAATAHAATGLSTDKRAYALAEPVVFTLRNDTPNPMSWSSISDWPVVWRVLPSGLEEVVREEPAIALLALGSLDPGKSTQWQWDQREYHRWYDVQNPPVQGQQVPPGRYIGRFRTLTHGTFASSPFEIGRPLAVRPSGRVAAVWARLKSAR
jgi:hypothetical protein